MTSKLQSGGSQYFCGLSSQKCDDDGKGVSKFSKIAWRHLFMDDPSVSESEIQTAVYGQLVNL